MPYSVRAGTGEDEGKKCVHKKDTWKKVGCTDGPVEKYLAALHANANEGVKITKKQLQEIIKEELAYILSKISKT